MKKTIQFIVTIVTLFSFAILNVYAFPNIPYNDDGFSHSADSGPALSEPFLKYTSYEFADNVNGNINTFFAGGDYTGGIFDGTNIWLVPSMSDRIIKINPANGQMTGYELSAGTNMTSLSSGPQSNKYMGGAYAAGYIWLFPHHSDRLVKVNPADGTIEGIALSAGINMTAASATSTFKYWGGVFDGTNIWLAPYASDRLAKISDLASPVPTITGYEMANGVNGNTGLSTSITVYGARFSGAVFDGANVWLVPRQADQLVRVNPATGAMTGFNLSAGSNMSPGSFVTSVDKYFGAVFDGTNIWVAPMASDRVLRVGNLSETAPDITGFDLTDGVNGNVNMSGYAGAGKFRGCVYDGKNVWLVPANDTRLVSIDPVSGRMTGYEIPYGRSMTDDMPYSNTDFYNYYNNNNFDAASNRYLYRSGVYDGKNIWLIPSPAVRLLKVSPSAEMTCSAPISDDQYVGDAIFVKIDNYMGAGSVIDSVEWFAVPFDDNSNYSYKDDFNTVYTAEGIKKDKIDRPGDTLQIGISETAKYWIRANLTDSSGEAVTIIKPITMMYVPPLPVSPPAPIRGTPNSNYTPVTEENTVIIEEEAPPLAAAPNPQTGRIHSPVFGTIIGGALILSAFGLLCRKRHKAN